MSTFVSQQSQYTCTRTVGGEMSLTCFVEPNNLNYFASKDQQRLHGLNAEAISRVYLPPPEWLLSAKYALLQSQHKLGDPACPYMNFSLNISIFPRSVSSKNWKGQWFFMSGRVHPSALTWKIKNPHQPHRISNYTIPALLVRDHSYQHILLGDLSTANIFPSISPIVSFTGPIIGSGSTLLHSSAISALGDIQLKCCGFIKLSTYISPSGSSTTPSRGFHPFRVFVIFPVYAEPWKSLCTKMIQKQDTQFQPNTYFTCTGKVAGLLDHDLMVTPPKSKKDYIFIIVPDSWSFMEKDLRILDQEPPTIPALSTPSIPTPLTSLDNDMARFMSFASGADVPTLPVTPTSAMPSTPCARAPLSTPPMSSSKEVWFSQNSGPASRVQGPPANLFQTPSKTSHLLHSSTPTTNSTSITSTSNTTILSSKELDDLLDGISDISDFSDIYDASPKLLPTKPKQNVTCSDQLLNNSYHTPPSSMGNNLPGLSIPQTGIVEEAFSSENPTVSSEHGPATDNDPKSNKPRTPQSNQADPSPEQPSMIDSCQSDTTQLEPTPQSSIIAASASTSDPSSITGHIGSLSSTHGLLSTQNLRSPALALEHTGSLSSQAPTITQIPDSPNQNILDSLSEIKVDITATSVEETPNPSLVVSDTSEQVSPALLKRGNTNTYQPPAKRSRFQKPPSDHSPESLATSATSLPTENINDHSTSSDINLASTTPLIEPTSPTAPNATDLVAPDYTNLLKVGVAPGRPQRSRVATKKKAESRKVK